MDIVIIESTVAMSDSSSLASELLELHSDEDSSYGSVEVHTSPPAALRLRQHGPNGSAALPVPPIHSVNAGRSSVKCSVVPACQYYTSIMSWLSG